MKPFFCLLILLFLMPVSCTFAVVGLLGETTTYEPATVASLARPGGGPDSRIRVEGFLLRLRAPDDAFDGENYVFPFVDQVTAERAIVDGSFTHSDAETPVIALVHSDSLPVEAFARPPAGRSEPVAIPYVLEGTRRVKEVKPTSIIARAGGLSSTREVVLLDGSSGEISRSEAIVFAVLAALFLLLGLRLARSWRRDRRETREAIAQYMQRRERDRRAAASAAGPVSTPPARPQPSSGRSWSLPWGKIAGVFIVLGIMGARLGKTVAPVAEGVARGVAKTADDVTSAAKGAGRAASDGAAPTARGLELPSAGEVALEGLGQAPNVKSVVQGVNGLRPGEKLPAASRSTTRLTLRIKVLDSKETYVPIEPTSAEGGSADVLTFALTKIRTEEEVSGSITGASPISETRTRTDLPDAKRGEFTRIELRRTAAGARFTHVLAIAVEQGYVEVMRATGDLKFAGAGSWEGLTSGEHPVVLLFTEEGTEEYARTIERMIERDGAVSLREQGLPGMSLTATYTSPPVQDLVFDKGKLTLRQRGIAILEMKGSNR